MKRRSLILLFFLAIGLHSCTSITSAFLNVNNKRKFVSQEIYREKQFAKKKYTQEKIIFLSNSELGIIMEDVIDKKLSTYYGIFNGSSFVSADQLTVKSCQGQIATLYRQFKERDNRIVINDASTVDVLKSLKLNSTKRTVIFLYSYKLGRLSKSKIDSVIEQLQKDDDFDYRIVSLDNQDILGG